MQLGFGRGASRAAESPTSCLGLVLAAVCAMALAGCNLDGQAGPSAGQPRGATIAFESIDGPPPGQFHTLVQSLNDEAQARRLAVISREIPSAYRARGYLAAKTAKGETTISWVWDVFDNDEHRALRISGEETAKFKGRRRDAWSSADDALLHRIAQASVEQLATFLTSPDVAPGTPGEPQIAAVGGPDSSPEAAGIFRIFKANADPVATEATEGPAAGDENTGSVPLPRRKPVQAAAVSATEIVTLSASSH